MSGSLNADCQRQINTTRHLAAKAASPLSAGCILCLGDSVSDSDPEDSSSDSDSELSNFLSGDRSPSSSEPELE